MAVVFSSLGLSIIIFGAISYPGKTEAPPIFTIGSGVAMSSIGALFLIYAKRSQVSVDRFLDSVKKGSDRVHSLILVSQIDDEEVQDGVLAYLSLHYAGLEDRQATVEQLIKLMDWECR